MLTKYELLCPYIHYFDIVKTLHDNIENAPLQLAPLLAIQILLYLHVPKGIQYINMLVVKNYKF